MLFYKVQLTKNETCHTVSSINVHENSTLGYILCKNRILSNPFKVDGSGSHDISGCDIMSQLSKFSFSEDGLHWPFLKIFSRRAIFQERSMYTTKLYQL